MHQLAKLMDAIALPRYLIQMLRHLHPLRPRPHQHQARKTVNLLVSSAQRPVQLLFYVGLCALLRDTHAALHVLLFGQRAVGYFPE